MFPERQGQKNAWGAAFPPRPFLGFSQPTPGGRLHACAEEAGSLTLGRMRAAPREGAASQPRQPGLRSSSRSCGGAGLASAPRPEKGERSAAN